MKNQDLQSEFGARLVTLNTGAQGLRSGLPATVKAVEGPAPQFDFIASDETTDRYGEVIRLAGWDLRNFKDNPVIPDCHDYSSISRILGKAVSIEVKGGTLRNRVEFCLDNPLGTLAYKLTQGGFLKCQSVGFIPLAWENGNGIDEPKRTYTRQELTEISLVVVPANPGATIGAALKSGALVKSDLAEAHSFVRFLAQSPQTPSAHSAFADMSAAQVCVLARRMMAVLRHA